MDAATRRRGAAPAPPLSGFGASALRAPYASPRSAAPCAPCSPLLAASAREDSGLAGRVPPPGTAEVVLTALKKAGGGGAAGAAAMAANVAALMWLRTTVCFQYRYGMSTSAAMRHLYNDGGALSLAL